MDNNDRLEMLREARKLIVDGGWTRHAVARNKDDKPVNHSSHSAVCWCLAGACVKVMGIGNYAMPFIEDTFAFDPIVKNRGIEVWNDWPRRTKNSVVTMIDRAIEHWEKHA